jgi:hypothetical protein
MSLDYFMPVQTFSEIENARAVLHALAARSLQELRYRRIEAGRPDPGQPEPNPVRDEQITRLIRDFHSAIGDFTGTGHEWLFVRDLLGLLRNEQRHDEWIDLYLQAFHRHPTHDLILRLVPDALRIGQAAHREDDILEAVAFLQVIPGHLVTAPRPGSTPAQPKSQATPPFYLVQHALARPVHTGAD